jgi:hypothetical protein
LQKEIICATLCEVLCVRGWFFIWKETCHEELGFDGVMRFGKQSYNTMDKITVTQNGAIGRLAPGMYRMSTGMVAKNY